MVEVWKDIAGYEGLYQVSNMGRVKSLSKKCGRRTSKEKIMNPFISWDGYNLITFCKDGKTKHFRIHRLVAEAFIPNPNGLPCVNHKDLSTTNNAVDNLEWCTHEYNNTYAGRAIKTARKNMKPICQFDLNGHLIREWESGSKIQQELGYEKTHIYSCCTGKRKTANGYTWKFKEPD